MFWFVTNNGLGGNKLGQSIKTDMTETTMPQGRRHGEGGCAAGGGREERVEVTRAIAPGDHAPCLKILHREAKRVKLDRTVIINSEAANGNQVLNNAGGHKNIIKYKRTLRSSKRV
jgi:hypothetical protein